MWKDKFDQAREVAENNRGNLTAGLGLQGKAVELQGANYNALNTGKLGIQQAMDEALLQNSQDQNAAKAQNAANPSAKSAIITGLLGGSAAATDKLGATASQEK